MKFSFKTTHLFGYLLVVMLMGLLTIYAGISFIKETVVKEAKLRVQMDLNSAWSAFNEEEALLQMAVGLASQNESLRDAISRETNPPDISSKLEEYRSDYGLDYLTFVDKNGIVIGGSRIYGSKGHSVRKDPIIQQALNGSVASGTILISRDNLKLKSTELADRAYTPFVPTERERPTDKMFEDRGMALETAIPVLNSKDEVIGALYGGVLLNRKHLLVDGIRNAVFGDQNYKGRPLGTVTIFLWDVRIATNVIKSDSTRAIGTRVSEEVYEKVLVEGERFGDRAFVVNDWYLSAYDPIKDPTGNTIGILYVGLLEQKYLDYQSELIYKFLGIGIGALILSFAFASLISARIRRPILKLVNATRKISEGELSTRVGMSDGSREIVELAESFNSMAESLETRSCELEKTTAALQDALNKADEKNRQYLEMLGFVTHELKSPLASIVFGIGAVRDKLLGPLTDPQEQTLKAASNSADYLSGTIANYLNLSRIEEGELKVKLSDVMLLETVIEPVLQRLSEMAIDNKMKIECIIDKNLMLACDQNLMTSVFQNLISNAIKYGKKGGVIEIKAEDKMFEYEFEVYNEGPGFQNSEKEILFTKFSRFNALNYDTKSGTGLGLFVTKVIIEKHGGKIWADSKTGSWAKFIFTLPKQEKK